AAIDQAQGPGKLPSRSGEVAARQGTSSQVGGAADGVHWSTAQPGPITPITLAQPSTRPSLRATPAPGNDVGGRADAPAGPPDRRQHRLHRHDTARGAE
ncbi:hypothetical protein, partial [Pseudomonas sp. S44]|uniref:hypothetical protein n=1 Tax=Pseudomonas sp. S44 TaxID=2767450 RepID=UPI001F39D29F